MKKFKDSWLFAYLVINLIVLVAIIIFSAYDNLITDMGIWSWQKNVHDFWLEIAILEIPAFIAITLLGIINKVLEWRDKKKK